MAQGPKKPVAPIFTEDATIPTTQSPQVPGARLLISGDGEPTSFPLTEAAAYTIGRALEADIYVKDPSLSRLHAALTFDPRGTLKIRDLDSSNGTTLRGHRLPPGVDHPFELGEPVEIGRLTLVVQRGAPSERPRRVWPHSYFELRLEDVCARSRGKSEPFAILRVRMRGEVPTSASEAALTTLLGPDDLIAGYAPREYDILLERGGRREAEQAAAAIRFGLERLGSTPEIGVACFPRDGREPGELIARASANARGQNVKSRASRQEVVIEDPAMQRLYALIDRVAESDIGILILGETGVGKEIVANAVHTRSRRSSSPFLALNCGAFSHELLESELFGHEKGAFTGAVQAKPGLFEIVGQGTVFLDEVGEMSLSTQVKLLRVLEERTFRRLGGLENLPLGARILAATNRNLELAQKEGRFREDLYYRLNGFTLQIPPLRERRSEIGAFARAFAKEMSSGLGSDAEPSFSPAALSALERYFWPGNVRELRNIIERAVVLADGENIDLPHLPMEKLSGRAASRSVRAGEPDVTLEALAISPDDLAPIIKSAPSAAPALRNKLDDLEREAILSALEACGGNQTRAAEQLGISRKSLLRRLDQYDLPRPRKGRSEPE